MVSRQFHLCPCTLPLPDSVSAHVPKVYPTILLVLISTSFTMFWHVQCIFKDHQVFNTLWILLALLTKHVANITYSHITLILTFMQLIWECTLYYLWFEITHRIIKNPCTIGAIQNRLKASTRQQVLQALCQSSEVETCDHCLQVSNIPIHVYPTLQLMQSKVLPIKFWGWKFCKWPADQKNLENYIPWKSLHVQ